MHPILIRFGPLDIHTYGVCVAAGFLTGLWVAGRCAKRWEGIDPDLIQNLGVWLVLSGMGGAKLFHIIFYWNDVVTGWRADGLRSLREGFVFYGGFICATLTTVVYSRVKQLPLAKLLDVLAPGLALGHAIGRLGCFFNGCCFGKPCSLPWAVKFPAQHIMAGVPVHPTQLYEVAGNIGIFVGLTLFYRLKRFDGQVWWLYVLSYGVLRFVIEFYRGDYLTYYHGVFTTAHFVAATMVVVATVALLRASYANLPSR